MGRWPKSQSDAFFLFFDFLEWCRDTGTQGKQQWAHLMLWRLSVKQLATSHSPGHWSCLVFVLSDLGISGFALLLWAVHCLPAHSFLLRLARGEVSVAYNQRPTSDTSYQETISLCELLSISGFIFHVWKGSSWATWFLISNSKKK